MAFYVGCYLVQQDSLSPPFDGAGWALPDVQHAKETSNVEELLMEPEDFCVVPEQIQFGCAQWTDEDDATVIQWSQFYVKTQENFYIRSFTAGTELYDTFYPETPSFYVRGFTAGTELYDTFYVRQENFYLRAFTAGTDLYNTFYMEQPSFYVRSFTGTDFFYSIPEDIC